MREQIHLYRQEQPAASGQRSRQLRFPIRQGTTIPVERPPGAERDYRWLADQPSAASQLGSVPSLRRPADGRLEPGDFQSFTQPVVRHIQVPTSAALYVAHQSVAVPWRHRPEALESGFDTDEDIPYS